MKNRKYSAILCNSFGSINNIELVKFDSLPIKNNQVRIEVKACGVNFPDKLRKISSKFLSPSSLCL